MKGEYTRNTFRRDRHYSGVRLLQGRVFMDADHNEAQDIAAHRDQTTTADVVGPDGAPDLGGGFRLSASARVNSLDLAGPVARAVGGRGTVLASADSGVTWTAQTLPAAQLGVNLLGVDVIDATHAFAVGEGGTILAHDGAAWTLKTAADAAGRRLRGVHFTTALAGWVVGDGGLLLGTADGGTTWVKRTAAGVTETLRAVHFPDAAHGWAVGDGGRIVVTADSGATWTVQPPPTGVTANLHAVRFADAGRGWAVGDGATILSTLDGGATWTARQAPAGVASALRGVDAASTATVWAAGDGGTVLRSTDAGATWDDLAFPSAAALTSVRATAVATATVAGDLSTIARLTVSGGGVTAAPVPRPTVARDLTISSGRIYVDGLLCENERALAYLAQPDYPAAPVPATAGLRMAYLDVWTRHLTALDRAELRDVALGGPDTATRTQTVWQVRLDETVLADGTTCAQAVPGWTPPEGPGTGRLRARSSPAAIAVNDCMVPAGGGYRRLENQLYRVEILKAGPAGTATYVWSRDNGAVVARLVATDPAATAMTVTLSDAGRDAVGGFAGAQLIELTDDRRILRGVPGELLRVQSITGKVVKVQDVPPAMSQFAGGAIVRRWDGTGKVNAGGWDTLGTEEGVQVEFSGGNYRTGDHWTVPARSFSGDVEWPRQSGTPVFQPREGIEHHHCPLALVRVSADGSLEVLGDCRPQFTALVRQTHLHMAGGDGQEVMPPPTGGLATLPQPLQVAVVNGRRPVNGARVRFTVKDTNDRLNGTVTTTVATTGAPGTAGMAEVAWALSTAATTPHQVVAQLLDPDDTVVGPELHFDASFSVARQVFYDPSAASDMAGMFNVQDAIDRLSRRSGGVCTVNVRPGDDVQAAVEALPAGGGELCFAAGEFKLTDPLHVTKRGRVTITGRGPSTLLRCGHEVVAVIKECHDVEVSHMRVEAGGMGTAPGEEHIMGALTFLDCIDIDVHDCELACPDATGGRAQSCLTIHGLGQGRIAERARIRGNRLETGVGQVGMLVTEPRLAEITGNHVVPSWSATPIMTHVPPKSPNPLTDGNDPRAIQQGIVIGGPNIGVARISDNVLERVIQGIHVGAATGGELDRRPGFAVQVSLSRNVVYSVVEAGYRRERHAIFVGSAFSVTITDTFAYCARPGGDRTPMDAIRVIGQLGEYALVRGSHLTGYDFGVRLQPRPDPGDAALPHSMWLVAETFARDASAAFVGSAAVRTENNVAV